MLLVSNSYAKSFIVGVRKENKESADHRCKFRWFITPIAVKLKKKQTNTHNDFKEKFKCYVLEKIYRKPMKGRKGNCNCGERRSP